MKISASASLLSVILGCPFITACTPSLYTPPTSGASAQLTIPARSNVDVGVMKDARLCQDRTWMSLGDHADNITRSILANTPVTLYLYTRRGDRKCEAVVSFKPEANQNYLFTPTWKQAGFGSSVFNNDMGHCTYTITNTNTHQAAKLVVRNYVNSVFSKAHCEDGMAEGQANSEEVTSASAPIYYKNV